MCASFPSHAISLIHCACTDSCIEICFIGRRTFAILSLSLSIVYDATKIASQCHNLFCSLSSYTFCLNVLYLMLHFVVKVSVHMKFTYISQIAPYICLLRLVFLMLIPMHGAHVCIYDYDCYNTHHEWMSELERSAYVQFFFWLFLSMRKHFCKMCTKYEPDVMHHDTSCTIQCSFTLCTLKNLYGREKPKTLANDIQTHIQMGGCRDLTTIRTHKLIIKRMKSAPNTQNSLSFRAWLSRFFFFTVHVSLAAWRLFYILGFPWQEKKPKRNVFFSEIRVYSWINSVSW